MADFLLLVLSIFIPGITVAALVYMTAIYRRTTEPRSWIFRMMVVSGWAQGISGTYLGYTTVARIVDEKFSGLMPVLDVDLGRLAVIVVAIVLITTPVYHAAVIFRSRRETPLDPGQPTSV